MSCADFLEVLSRMAHLSSMPDSTDLAAHGVQDAFNYFEQLVRDGSSTTGGVVWPCVRVFNGQLTPHAVFACALCCRSQQAFVIVDWS